jgi:hypothetical protein
MTPNFHRRAQICRILTYVVPCALILAGGISWLWRGHNPSPCDSFPELCRPPGGEAQP